MFYRAFTWRSINMAHAHEDCSGYSKVKEGFKFYKICSTGFVLLCVF